MTWSMKVKKGSLKSLPKIILGLNITILISGCPSSKARAVLSTKVLAEGEYFPFWELGNSKSGSNQSSISSLMGGSTSFGFVEPGNIESVSKMVDTFDKNIPTDSVLYMPHGLEPVLMRRPFRSTTINWVPTYQILYVSHRT